MGNLTQCFTEKVPYHPGFSTSPLFDLEELCKSAS
jgi:hypothetical protein